jgi:hypothetical protein
MPASTAPERNPFMLMTHPEVVIAAMEKSERLGGLRRQICRPLDKVAAPAGDDVAAGADAGSSSADGPDSVDRNDELAVQVDAPLDCAAVPAVSTPN